MTNGTSQGLFAIIAIVIFGIFVFISYLLFKNNLNPTLANIFTDGLTQSNCTVSGQDESSSTCNPKFNNSFKITKYVTIGFVDNNAPFGTTSYPEIWSTTDSSTRTINLKPYLDSGASLNIENGLVEISTISDYSVYVKEDYLNNGFGSDKSRKLYVSINQAPDKDLGSSDYPNTGWGKNKGIKLRIGELNTIKFTYENVYGGKTVYTFQVKIVNE
ncbi:hypothetical protein ACE4Y5_03605 [Enterococcus faecalis]|uniref:hypothetical protein n=1 Tax=Enterococcus faecalis TaxID=1351 RepID=UPI0035CA5F88